jgi:hypothetical protein
VTQFHPPGGSSRLRVGGFVLLGVAAVAAVGGLVSLAGGGHTTNAAGSVPSARPSAAARPPGPPPVLKPVQPPPAAPRPTVATPLPGAGLPPVSSGSGLGKGSEPAVVRAPVRVYNNSLIKDLAERAASDFRGDGWSVSSVGNYPYDNIPTSTVYYQPGSSQQRAAARYLASSFGMRAEPRFAGLEAATPGLIVIVTKDYQRR